MHKFLTIANEDEMMALGGYLVRRCKNTCIVFLQGELGAGKTTLVRGFLRSLGFTGAVKSPTYTFVEPYNLAGKEIYHFDLYRLQDPEELEFMGVRDYFQGKAICLIEWPERAEKMLPKADFAIKIEILDHGRRVSIEDAADC